MTGHSHQLAAILFADIVGYTAMMQQDEEAAVAKLTRFREEMELVAGELNGKIIQYYGDGSLILFHSSTDAAEFAKLLQEELAEEPSVPVRIGIHMGDVLLQDGNVFGDVVNIASRIQALAPAGGVYISEMVYRNIENKKGLDAVYLKEVKLKNVKAPVHVYELVTKTGRPDFEGVLQESLNDLRIQQNSIAVLPFENMSSDQEQEYFSDGLTEDIITQLSKIKSLKVVSRTSVMQYKRNPKPMKEIGKELAVANILEGSVRKMGEQVRITAQLINASTDDHLWAESYDKPVKDLFNIQKDVATAIAQVLNARITHKESKSLGEKPTTDLHAYDLYLRGRFLIEKRNKTDVLTARSLFQQAVDIDKTFANAYSGLADTYLLASYRGYDEPDKMLTIARQHIDKALKLDPDSGETHASLGYWYHQTFDWGRAEKTYRKAIGFNPNQSNVYLWLALILEAKGEIEEAIQLYHDGSELNQLWVYLLQNKIRALCNKNNQDEVIALQKNLIEKFSFDPEQQKERYAELSRLYWFLGSTAEAAEAAKKAGNQGLLEYYRSKDIMRLVFEVEDHYKRLKESGEYISNLWMGVDYAKAGAREKALECFNAAIDAKEPAITLLMVRHYEFLNIKYLNLVPLARKIRQLIKY
jgi:TolB-like protein/class 3 adenylate cyclase